MANAWDRLDGEPASHFAMFIYYRDLGPIRTYETVRREFKRSPSFFGEIQRKWKWKERALSYDTHLDSVRQGATRLIVHNMAQRQAALGVRMQSLGESRLKEFADKPELMATVPISDAIKLVSEGVRIERLAEGETTGEEGQPMIFNIVGAMPKWAPATLTGGVQDGSPSPSSPSSSPDSAGSPVGVQPEHGDTHLS